ncbi:hypothetical protein PHYPSEUDO_009117 [Phytophthora pseudosyringae]|uniref:Cyclic nucleotide-binding domain-containing protein n=1 Tax=Phytophthora pseudosyringae TaxID=221518 RepID=A0A8T1VDB4_9STRA|nr:hypothetical protein PHYPSEUDO_009117 [Phytophthora pseudosyringae]
MQSGPPPPTIKRMGSDRTRTGLLMSKLSSRNLYDLQVKSADYEVMMARFQLRKVSKDNIDGGKLRLAIIDTAYGNKSRGSKWRLLSPRRFAYLLTRKKTWRYVWKTVTSPIPPGGCMCRLHGFLMFGVNQFELFYLPFALSFYPHGSSGTVTTGLILQLLHLADLLLTFNTAFMRQREFITSRSAIARDHVNKWFGLEVVSAVPVAIVYSVTDGCERITMILLRCDVALIALRLLHLVVVEQSMLPKRLFRDNKQLVSWFQYSRYAHLLGIAKLIWLVLLVTHYMGCVWHMLSGLQLEASVGEKYVASFYYAVQLIQGQGNGSGTWGQNLFSTFVILTGSVILAIVFGNVAMLVSSFNANTTTYHQKMEGVFATMDKMGLPLKLQERVHQYYTHVWTEYQSLDGDIVKFQRELAHTLRLEVGLYKYMNLVMKIQFWESCSPDFATQIILNLAIRVYLPDDYIVRKGDTGDEMFMINRGICELSDPADSQEPKNVAILASSSSGGPEMLSGADQIMENTSESSEEGEKTLDAELEPVSSQSSHSKVGAKSFFRRGSKDIEKKTQPHKSKYEINPDEKQPTKKVKPQILLYPGQAFGEMSLLMNYKRTANIRAATYVEICVLTRATFQRIICRYPEDRRHVLTMMIKSCIEKKEIPFPWDEVVDAVAERRRKYGTMSSSRRNVQATVTSTEAAQALVDRIDANQPDESIKYGFQTFHPDLMRQGSAESAVGTASIDISSPKLRQKRLVVNQNEDGNSGLTEGTNKTDPVGADSRIEGLEKTLATMMTVMNSMAASIERLERQAQNRDKVYTYCQACQTRLRDTCAKHVHDEGEARGADYTESSLSPRMKIRRCKDSASLNSEIPKLDGNSLEKEPTAKHSSPPNGPSKSAQSVAPAISTGHDFELAEVSYTGSDDCGSKVAGVMIHL